MAGAAALLAAGVAAAGPSNLLTNASFEVANPDPAFVFEGWQAFGNAIPNISQSSEFPRTGPAACKIFGQFNFPDNVSLVVQDVPAQHRDVFAGSVWAGQLASDALAEGNFAALNIEFRDGADNLLGFLSVTALDEDDPDDLYLQTMVSGAAPVGTEVCRFAVLLFQPLFGTGAVHFDDAVLELAGVDEGLINGNFEMQGSAVGPMPAWQALGFNENPDEPNITQSPEQPNSGALGGLIFGLFPGDGSDAVTNIFQVVDAVAGDEISATVFASHLESDPVVGDSIGFLNIEYRDAADELISFDTVTAISSADPTGTQLERTVSGTAPADTVSARVVIGFVQVNDGTGAFLFDDATVTVTPGSGGDDCPEDVTGDGTIDIADLNLVLTNFNSMTSEGDATGDGMVDIADLNAVLTVFNQSCPTQP